MTSLFPMKKKSSDDLKVEIDQLKYELRKKEGKLKSERQLVIDQLKKKDPDAARMFEHGLVEASIDKKGKLVGPKGQEEFEKFQHRFVKTEFPAPIRRFRIMLEYPSLNLEQIYYWFLAYINENWGFEEVEKVIDTMSQSVSSSNFGNLQARLGAQQAQASQYLKGISEMVKGLFQIVREVRIIDDRLQYYYDSDGDPKGIKEASLSSEIVLKGLWVDQVEGGAKNPASIYGLSQTIGFTILPDLFFRMRTSRESIESDVNKLQFNAKVKEVLKRKLRQYYEWKIRTKKELEVRRDFEIKYMKQHYETIKMYMAWVKPYLRNIRRLQIYEKNMEDPNIIHSFETQIMELETLFMRKDFGHAHACVSLHIFYRAKPELSFHSHEYQHKGPIYTGLADITIRAYDWDDKKIEKYLNYRREDDIDLVASIDKSVQDAMDALGDDLKKYLKEADPSLDFGDEAKKEEEKKKDLMHAGMLEPFVAIFDGFKEIAQGFSGGPASKEKKPEKKKKEKKKWEETTKHHRAGHYAAEAAWEAYYRFKMGPGGNLYWVE
jgi:hypothetical protein